MRPGIETRADVTKVVEQAFDGCADSVPADGR